MMCGSSQSHRQSDLTHEHPITRTATSTIAIPINYEK
jgi:hypothetical protein